MGRDRFIKISLWTIVALSIIMFIVLIVIGHSNSFDFYYN